MIQQSSINIIYYINRTKGKIKHMIISKDIQKKHDKIQHFMIKKKKKTAKQDKEHLLIKDPGLTSSSVVKD